MRIIIDSDHLDLFRQPITKNQFVEKIGVSYKQSITYFKRWELYGLIFIYGKEKSTGGAPSIRYIITPIGLALLNHILKVKPKEDKQ